MKFLVIGLGSMGKRRIRLLLNHFTPEMLCGADTSYKKRRQAEELFGIITYADYDIAIMQENPQAALICTPPQSHADIILRCIAQGVHIFSEVNLIADKYNEIVSAAQQKNLVLFLSSTQLYRKEIQSVKDVVSKQHDAVNYRYHVGQYLPDWHPWDKSKEFFAWHKRTDGCREILAIELPWLIRVFGKVAYVTVVKDKISGLNIDFPDNYLLILEHENKNKGVFIVDVVARKAQQSLLVYSDKLHLSWEGTPETLCQYDIQKRITAPIMTYKTIDRNDIYAENIIENAYADELSAFLMALKGQADSRSYTFQEDLETLQLIDKIQGALS